MKTKTSSVPLRAPHCRRAVKSKARDDSSDSSAAVELLCRLRMPVFFVVVMLYVVGFLLCAGSVSMLMHPPAAPGSVYRSPELFKKLWPEMQLDNSSGVDLNAVWKYGKRLKQWKPCTNSSIEHSGNKPGAA